MIVLLMHCPIALWFTMYLNANVKAYLKASMERREKLPEESLLNFSITHFNLTRTAAADISTEVLRKLGLQKSRYMYACAFMHVYTSMLIYVFVCANICVGAMDILQCFALCIFLSAEKFTVCLKLSMLIEPFHSYCLSPYIQCVITIV